MAPTLGSPSFLGQAPEFQMAPLIENYSDMLLEPASCMCMKCNGRKAPDATFCSAKASDVGQVCVSDSTTNGCYSSLSNYGCTCPGTPGPKVSNTVPTTCSCMKCGLGGHKGPWTSGSCAAAASPAGQSCIKNPLSDGCVSSLDDYGCLCPGTVGANIRTYQLAQLKKDAAAREVYKRDHCGTLGNNAGPQMGDTLYAESSCACASICSHTEGCAGWTYAPSFGVVNDTGGLNACFLRSAYDGMVNNCATDCWSAPVDPCGMPWNFCAKQQTTVTAASSCQCKEACDRLDICDAWTYYYDYNDGKDNCWIMNTAGNGQNVNCKGTCFAGQKLKAKCGTTGRGLGFATFTSIMMYTLSATDPCTCEKVCIQSAGECKGWTYELGGSTGTMKDTKENKCILYSQVFYTKTCSTCISGTVPGFAAKIHELEQAKSDKEAAESEAALAKTVCAKVTNKTGNFSYIASPLYPHTENWTALDPTAYKVLSKYLTTIGVPGEVVTLSEDVRSTYPLVIGTAVVGSYASLLFDSLALEAAQKTANVDTEDWNAAILQLRQEVRMLQLVGAWFETYSRLFALAGDQVFEAFTTTAAIVSMPGTTQVAGSKVHGWKIALKVLKVCCTVAMIVATDGGYAAAAGAEKAAKKVEKAAQDAKDGIKSAKAIGKAAAASEKAYKATKETLDKINFIARNIQWALNSITLGFKTANIAPATAGGANPEAAADATAATYYDLIANVQVMLNEIWKSISAERMIIAGNYGRLSVAAAAAEACPITDNELEIIVSHTYGGMQWIALGQLLPTKYAIYFQRDYMGGKGPDCYYNNCGGGTSSGQCGSSSDDVLGCQGTTMGCYEPSRSKYDRCNVKLGGVEWPAKRAVWMGQQNNPSKVPAESMWQALSDGPVTSYINKKFRTAYTGAYGAFEAFMTQCAYVSKVYIPGGSITYSETQASTVSVDCDVYGITIPTFAMMDCGTQVTKNGVAWNGYGINKDGDSGDGTGNFNQFTYIPNKPGSWSSISDGQVGCCLPWKGSVELPSGCDYILCDCFTLAIMGNDGDADGNKDGQWESNYKGTWWNECQVVTDEPSKKQYVQTSFGPYGPWQRIITSGNQYSEMKGLQDVQLT